MNDEYPILDTPDAIEEGARIEGAGHYQMAVLSVRDMAINVNGVAKHLNAFRRLDGGCDGAHQYHDEDLAISRETAAQRLATLPKDAQAVIIGLIADLAAGGEQGAIERAWRDAMDFYHAHMAYAEEHAKTCSGCEECMDPQELWERNRTHNT